MSGYRLTKNCIFSLIFIQNHAYHVNPIKNYAFLALVALKVELKYDSRKNVFSKTEILGTS